MTAPAGRTGWNSRTRDSVREQRLALRNQTRGVAHGGHPWRVGRAADRPGGSPRPPSAASSAKCHSVTKPKRRPAMSTTGTASARALSMVRAAVAKSSPLLARGRARPRSNVWTGVRCAPSGPGGHSRAIVSLVQHPGPALVIIHHDQMLGAPPVQPIPGGPHRGAPVHGRGTAGHDVGRGSRKASRFRRRNQRAASRLPFLGSLQRGSGDGRSTKIDQGTHCYPPFRRYPHAFLPGECVRTDAFLDVTSPDK
jgi:hypothetical protein